VGKKCLWTFRRPHSIEGSDVYNIKAQREHKRKHFMQICINQKKVGELWKIEGASSTTPPS